ncbi:hypothetical protein Nwi_2374 [Nitrobacter winogradskyi Nb-255]|uniref:Uncharacterized protein n=1 Tax=Nitrobacter winogradskyi (strain ATCC 25391 / DSM 10237 / CIP 104748 / NCIMB 11846 / Nb-255) TaxID=323098 RepID=Q3SQ13_NITWN|nr:hypothetical protein Nwi_2374 [Nitrobacter winogradskyi Nb-255]
MTRGWTGTRFQIVRLVSRTDWSLVSNDGAFYLGESAIATHVVRDPASRTAFFVQGRSIAFSSEVETGSREENASKQDHRASLLILSEAKRL